MRFVNIGFRNMVAAERIVCVLSPDSAPVRRLIQDAKDDGRAIDLTAGKKTRSVVVTDTEHVFMSAVQVGTVTARIEGADDTSADLSPSDNAETAADGE